jgi:TrmH family RNA methyltransferase
MKSLSSPTHDLVKHWSRLQKDRDYRQSIGRVLVEGKNLLRDLLRRHRPVRLIVTERNKDTFGNESGEVYLVTEAIAAKISSVETPEGCFAEFELPAPLASPDLDRVVIFDRLQDPGNVGTLLRTCLSFNIRTALLIEPCCDPWNPKCIRSAKGAQFDIQVLPCSWEHLPSIGPLFVADMAGADIRTIERPRRFALVLGNEAHGVKIPPSLPSCFVKIPMPGPMESLNVAQAGAILLYALLLE